MKYLNLTQRVFSRLTVLEFDSSVNGKRKWKCLCECGNITSVAASQLTLGLTKSCGCLQKEFASMQVHGQAQRGKKTPEYHTWVRIKSRCFSKTNPDYPYYGGRGIRVCNEWINNYQAFYDYIGPKPSPQHSIDRFPNKDGNYEPGNVRWALQKQQVLNQRSNVLITWKGTTQTMSEWADYWNVPYDRMRYLVNKHLRGNYGAENKETFIL